MLKTELEIRLKEVKQERDEALKEAEKFKKAQDAVDELSGQVDELRNEAFEKGNTIKKMEKDAEIAKGKEQYLVGQLNDLSELFNETLQAFKDNNKMLGIYFSNTKFIEESLDRKVAIFNGPPQPVQANPKK